MLAANSNGEYGMVLISGNTMRDRSITGIRTGVLLSALFALVLSMPASAEVRARLDRSTVYIGDPFTLVIESTGTSSGEPDLSPLNKDFRVLGTGTSTQFSFSNGRSSNRTTWTVQLGAQQTGRLQIPPIRVGSEQTGALELEVTDTPEQPSAQQSQHLFLEAEADTGTNAYVQQQIPYTLRLYHDETVINGDLRPPQLQDTPIRQLGDDRRYMVTRNNRRYQVLERRYMISPQKSGELRIPPASFTGQVDTQPPGTRSRRDSLTQRFFRNSPFGGGGRPVRAFSEAITIDVQPRPSGLGSDWLPAQNIELQDSWAGQPPKLRAGEPVTRTISLRATGLSGTQIPALQLEQPRHTRVYPETPVNESRTDGDKVYAISRQTFTYIPGRAGELTIPAIEVPWWDTRKDERATARLPQWVLKVEPGAAGTVPHTNKAPPRDRPLAASEQRAPGTEPEAPEQRWFTGITTPVWLWAVLALLALAAALLARRWLAGPGRQAGQVRPKAPETPHLRTPGVSDLLPQLQRACEANDARQAAQGLLDLGRARWPDDPPASLGQLAARLGRGEEQIKRLDRVLYAADPSTWNGAELWAAIRDAWAIKPIPQQPADDALEPLYPQNG